MTEPVRPTEATFLDLLVVLRRRWRIVIGLPAVLALITAVISFIMRPTYTATITFVPEAGTSAKLPSSLAGLAGEFGLSLGADASRSPRFYADVLKSRELLERALLTRYPDPRTTAGDSVRLLDLLRIRGRSGADSVFNGVRALSNRLGTRVDVQTGIVRLSVESRYAGLSAAVANQMVGYLNEFNTHTRQSQARERRRFVEQRITEAEGELRSAEGDLRTFYERNRTWQQAPQLMFEEGRLRRQVDIRQEVYLTLKREFETARIEEVNDTPVITVIDPAIAPQRRSSPQRKMMVLLALMGGALASSLWALIGAYTDQLRATGDRRYLEVFGRS